MFCFSVYGQSDKASLNSWKGLILGESSFEDSKKILGAPVKDKTNQSFTPLVYSKWFGNKLPKDLREVKFKGLDGFDSAVLYFRNDILVVIELDLKKDLSASALVDAYDSKFSPLVGNFASGVTPGDLAEGKREVIYPERFPLAYQMAAANEKSIGLAYASAGMAEAFAAGMMTPMGGRPGLTGSLPGLVRKLQLISRTLESTKGTDLLK